MEATTEKGDFQNNAILTPSNDFRKKGRTVIGAIGLFFLVYLLIVLLGIAILTACWYGSLWLFKQYPGFITLGIGIFLCISGLLFAAFTVKFLFAKSTEPIQEKLEVTRVDNPELFSFLDEVAKETRTKLPKRVFVSPAVNAMVFYKSGLISLIFPVRKQMEIGLGLVNTVNMSEFRGVIAHEFGHFSQKSLRLGVYIYTVNRVLFNLVYQHDSWDSLLGKWSSQGGPFAIFAHFIMLTTNPVRKLLRLTYDYVMVKYMDLSREMEFHADLIAANTAGCENYKNALRKIEFSQFAMDYELQILNQWIAKKKKTSDFLQNHTDTILALAVQNKIKTVNGALEITDQVIERSIIKTRLNIQNQWASHPPLNEREKNIQQLSRELNQDPKSPWTLFSNVPSLKNHLGQQIYQNAPNQDELQWAGPDEFIEELESTINRYKISEDYHGYFDDRYLRVDSLKEAEYIESSISFSQAFSVNRAEIIRKARINKMDLLTVKQIKEAKLPIRHFEFDGKKYSHKMCDSVIETLEKEAAIAESEIIQFDREMLRYFMDKASAAGKTAEIETIFSELLVHQNNLKLAEKNLETLQQFHIRLNSKTQWSPREVVKLNYEMGEIERDAIEILQRSDMAQIKSVFEFQHEKDYLEKIHTSDHMITQETFTNKTIEAVTTFVQMNHYAQSNLFGQQIKKLSDFSLELNRA